MPLWEQDEFNSDLRNRLGIGENDLVFLQATRILPRKAIELSFEFIRVFREEFLKDLRQGVRLYNGRKVNENSQIHFVLCGSAEEMDKSYLKEMKNIARKMSYPCHFISQLIGSHRKQKPKIYSLWDAYTIADIVTYPSIQEGWGNQLLEAVFAKKIIVGYEYPVLQTDILPKGIRMVSLGKNARMEEDGLFSLEPQTYLETAETLFNLLTDYTESNKLVEKNFSNGEKFFSCEVLQKALKGILESSTQG
jgi:hypothetical protein